jgi:hypothetical protein
LAGGYTIAILAASVLVIDHYLKFAANLFKTGNFLGLRRPGIPDYARLRASRAKPSPAAPPATDTAPDPVAPPAPEAAPRKDEDDDEDKKYEVYYRAMSRKEWSRMSFGLVFRESGGEKFVTTDIDYAKRAMRRHPDEYEIIVRFKLERGAGADFIAHGRAQQPEQVAGQTFNGHIVPLLPKAESGWTKRMIVLFKMEKEHLNIGFGPKSVELFNRRIRESEIVQGP